MVEDMVEVATRVDVAVCSAQDSACTNTIIHMIISVFMYICPFVQPWVLKRCGIQTSDWPENSSKRHQARNADF